MARSGRGSKLPPDEPVLFDLPLGLPEGDDGSDASDDFVEREPPRAVAKSRERSGSKGASASVRANEAPSPQDFLPLPEPEPIYPRAVPPLRSHRADVEADEIPVAAAVPDSVFPSGRERWIAGAADLLVHGAVLVVALIGVRVLGVHPGFAHALPLALFLASFSFLYTVIPLAFWGQTLGMGWMQTIARDRDGQALTFDQTARRWLGGVLATALLGIPVWIAVRGRSLSDWISGSITLRAGSDLEVDPDYGAA